MASRMTDAATPIAADSTRTEEETTAPTVTVLLNLIAGADLEAALSVLGRQVYEPAPKLVIVGELDDDSVDIDDGVVIVETLDEGIADHGEGVDYFWILHSDARPRPDALGALVAEVERNDASLGGSKLLVAASHDELESVGSATDVFGEPYTGLDDGEIDLQQYDVVREVAFVRSASMLVRRDLAQGLKGLDPLLPPIAAGLDFSQRTRLAGGRVVSVPSSEVYHQGRCNERGRGWREQAGRLRAMLTAYSLLTLLWMVPYEFVVGLIDSVGSLLLLRWRPAVRHLLSWLWNLIHLPSTIGQRIRFRNVRAAGDEELFRFQSKGSVRLRELGIELSGRILLMFDDDQALARGSRRVWASPGIWGAAIAAAIVAFCVRSLVFTGVPDAGFSFPFEPATVAFDRWFAGWSQSGLGSPATVHPSVGLTGLASGLLFGREGAARTLFTIGFAFIAVVGMGRLAGRVGLRGPGRYLAGIVLIAGPGTALLTGVGSWLGLAAAASLPWAVRAVMSHDHDAAKRGANRIGWAVLFAIPLAAFSPLLLAVPLLTSLLWFVLGGRNIKILALVTTALAAVVALPFLLGDPGWVTEQSRRLGLETEIWWAALVGVAALPLVFLEGNTRRVGLLGAVLSLGSVIGLAVPYGGPGIEEALLIVASFGAALVASAGLDKISRQPLRVLAGLTATAIVVMSVAVIADGRLGLRDGDINSRLAFSSTLAGPEGPGRILIASTDPADIPGEARPGPGFWYRVVDGQGLTNDQTWLPEPLAGDQSLDAVLGRIASGSDLRPGEALAPYAIEWVVLEGDPFRLDEVFLAQIDLVPTPLDPGSRVFENPTAVPLATDGADGGWKRDGASFSGDSGSGRVTLALNHAAGWQPESGAIDWWTSVSAVDGVAEFSGSPLDRALALASIALFALGLSLVLIGRPR